jgi:anti-sigma regulatory factor (Ser/Thr protein kinase)
LPAALWRREEIATNRTGNAAPVLDLIFDSGALVTLREEVRECAVQSGISEDRAEDMVLAIHELAANAVVHDGGAGRLRVWKLAAALQCQVDDADLMRSSKAGSSRDGMAGMQPGSAPGPVSADSLPSEKGHGLWLVRKLADQVKTLSGPHGTRVMIAFDLSR